MSPDSSLLFHPCYRVVDLTCFLRTAFPVFSVRYNAYEWRLLILDGHGSHETLEFLEYAFEHRSIPFLLIPHTTHLVQPLNVSLFGPLQHYYSQHLQESLRVGDSVGKGDFIRCAHSICEFCRYFAFQLIKDNLIAIFGQSASKLSWVTPCKRRSRARAFGQST